jgi:hypothetical protein
MWGTSLPEDKLGDLGNVIEATSIGVRRSDFFTARKLAPGNLGLLQQYLPKPDSCTAANKPFFSGRRGDKFIDKRCNNHRRIVAYGVLNCATSPTDHAMVDPGSYRFWVRNDSVLTTTGGSLLRSTTQFVRELPEAMRQRASIRDDH